MKAGNHHGQRLSRQARRERAADIIKKLNGGQRAHDIATQYDISSRAVQRIARKNCVEMMPGQRRFGFFTKRARAEAIIALADAAGVSPSTMIDRIVSTVVDEGMDVARRRLGKLALPRVERADV